MPLTPKLCTALNLACGHNSFDTLKSEIRLMVMNLLSLLWYDGKPKKNVNDFIMHFFTTTVASYPKVMDINGFGMLIPLF